MFYEVVGNERVDQRKKDAVKEILDDNKLKKNIIVTSVIAHLEVLPSKVAEKGANDEDDYLALFDAEHFEEIELNTNIILRAREIREYYYSPADQDGKGFKMMDVGDAIHLATATVRNSPVFHTRDNKKKKGNVPLLELYLNQTIAKVCGKYDLDIISPEAAQGSLGV
jgi:hypothetical protein